MGDAPSFDGGEAPKAFGLPVAGLNVEWEQVNALRAHLREPDAVIFPEKITESVKSASLPHIHGYLIPLLLRMASNEGRPQPLVDPLREEITLLYKQGFSKQIDEAQVIHDSWMTRKFLGLVKMKARKEKPSCDLLYVVEKCFVCSGFPQYSTQGFPY